MQKTWRNQTYMYSSIIKYLNLIKIFKSMKQNPIGWLDFMLERDPPLEVQQAVEYLGPHQGGEIPPPCCQSNVAETGAHGLPTVYRVHEETVEGLREWWADLWILETL